MLKPKEVTTNSDLLTSKASRLINRKVWPMPDAKDKEDWAKQIYFQQMINRPSEPRSRSLLRAEGLTDFPTIADINDRESFHCAIGSILGIAQCFGVMPLTGVRTESPKKLAMKYFSFRVAYAMAIMIMLVVMSAISIGHMIQTLRADTFSIHGGIGAATAGAIFYSNSLLGTALFMWLCPRWIPLQRDWRAMERILDRDKHQPPVLRWKFSMLTAVIMTFALIEHLLSIANNTPLHFWSSTSNLTVEDFLQSYCENSHAFIFSLCHYNLSMGIFIFVISKISTFTWNFTDVFVILVATGLAERYKSLNKRLITNTPYYRKNLDWREFRECYATLSTLVKNVDNKISPIILLSFGNNLYFICLQLLNGLSPSETNILGTVYFFGSFAFLVGRTVAVTLLTARINDQSKQALPALYNCPGPYYNIETQRLQQQLTTDEVCLTGLRFFSITRNFMLAVAGAIVTYEVVLLQFNVAMNK
ncbi:gustatory receptor for sugar taste 64e-like [Venturia canescens]|uniref:gustatory receptor for sugar taste 64e-like n=1 Tax=Venturia canescens TaxID=32260 RepID=UPI001C9BED8D|nr:gustatory receptor for sugar taste 64e-like [Venturia canescens]